MTNTTEEFWDADGESLHTYAQSIESSGETMRGVPALRGTDLQIPFRPGENWKRKVPGPRIITLRMWVRGRNPDNSAPTSGAAKHALFNDNFEKLKELLWRTDRRIQLTKRWKSSSGLIVVTALAEYAGGLDNIGIIDQYRDAQAGKFTADMKLADPYFYDDWKTIPHFGTVQNRGQDTARQLKITFTGAGHITNLTTDRTLFVKGACTVNTWAFSAQGQLEGLSTDGDPDEMFWFTLLRGSNSLQSHNVSSLQYRPVYL